MSSGRPEPDAVPSGHGSRRIRRGRSLAGRILGGLLAILLLTLSAYTAYVLALGTAVLRQQEAGNVAAAWNRAAQQMAASEPGELQTLPRVDESATTTLGGQEAHRPGSVAQPEGTLVGLVSRADLAAPSGDSLEAVVLKPDGGLRVVGAEELRDIVHTVGGLTQGQQATVRVGELDYRVQAGEVERAGPWIGGERVLVVGLPVGGFPEWQRRALAGTLAGILVLLAATLAAGRSWINRALRPLAQVADAAAAVSRMDLARGPHDLPGARVPPGVLDGVDEVALVGDALNRLITRVDATLDEQRRGEELLRAFVADASHELRTPLASVRGYAEMIALTEPLSPSGRRSLERVLSQADRMTDLVDGMLVLARLESAERERRRGAPTTPDASAEGSVDLCEVVLDAVMDARAAWPDHRWVLEIPDHDAVDPHWSVPATEDTVSRIVTNILSNAGKHTPPGTTVDVSVRREEGEGGGPAMALFQVRDDGGGIPAHEHPTLFDRFVRGVGVNASKEHSTGLGLPIVQAAARGLGGDVTVASEPGWTRFDVVLPLVEVPGEDAPGQASRGRSEGSSETG